MKSNTIFLQHLFLQLQMQSDHKEVETLKKLDSIVNFKELYYQERELRIELQRQLELERIKVKKLTSNSRSKTRYCAYCSANISSKKAISKDDNQLIDDFKNFSSKLSSMKFTTSLPYDAQPSLISKIEEYDPNRRRHVGMVQNFAIFGINQSEIKDFILEGKQAREFQGQILYSKKQKNDSEMQASKLVFPSGMAIKKYNNIKAKEKTIELMSNCYTNLKSFVLSFECPDSNFKEHFHHNDLLHHMNPEHRLFCICMGIHDYTYIDKKKDRFNNSLGVITNSEKSIILEEYPQIKSEGHQMNIEQLKQSNKSIDDGVDNLNQLQIGITQRVFCIMTYFPFFSFFEDILRNLINIVKMDRLVVYKHNQENIKLTIKQTDSLFQKETIVKYFDDIMRDLQYKKLSFNKEYELRLINQQKITQMTYWDEAKSFFVREWIYSILSMFTFETFLEVFTLIMLEDKVVFICENSHILTHTIYLFAHVLMKPLNYSFPIVSIIPGDQQDFLNAPFPVVYGMLKKRKSVEEKRILQNYDNTYVFLSPEKVDIYYQEDRKQILNNKSTKLLNHKQLKQLFKDLKKTRKKEPKSVKYELQSSDYCILANADEKQRGVKILNLISQFINQQIVKKLPSQVQIQNLRKKTDFKQLNEQKDEHTHLMGMVIADFKKTSKDPFVLQMLSTQMINNFLFTQT